MSRNYYPILALLMLLISCYSAEKQESQHTERPLPDTSRTQKLPQALFFPGDSLLETHRFDLNRDSIPDAIYLLNPSAEFGGFTKLLVQIGEDTLSAHTPDAWDTLQFAAANNLINSRRLYIGLSHKAPYLFLSGPQGSCCPRLSVFRYENRSFRRIFDEPIEIAELTDLNADGRLELIGRQQEVEGLRQLDSHDALLGSYVPYRAYTLAFPGVQFNDTLSEAYNRRHYVYLGPFAERVNVVYPHDTNQKPYLLDPLDSLACNFDVLQAMQRALQAPEAPDAQTIDRFLLSFDKRCHDKVEFGELSAELLISLLNQHPEKLIARLDKPAHPLDMGSIKAEIVAPLIKYDIPKLRARLDSLPPSPYRDSLRQWVRTSYP